MGLYAFGIVSKRPFYFFGAPRVRARRLFCFLIQIQRFFCKNLVFDDDFYVFFVEMFCCFIVFLFLLLTFDVALRLQHPAVDCRPGDGVPTGASGVRLSPARGQ